METDLENRRPSANATVVQDGRRWSQTLLAYRQPNLGRSIVELVITFVPLVGAVGGILGGNPFRLLVGFTGDRSGGGRISAAAVHDPA